MWLLSTGRQYAIDQCCVDVSLEFIQHECDGNLLIIFHILLNNSDTMECLNYLFINDAWSLYFNQVYHKKYSAFPS